jgi:hypothetical protein
MKFETDGENLIIKLPLLQSGDDTYGSGKWKAQNFLFIKTWSKELDDWDYTISQGIWLDYKGDMQEGLPIIHLSEEEAKEAMKVCGDDLFTVHPRCSKCKKSIYGCFSIDGDGNKICMHCESIF